MRTHDARDRYDARPRRHPLTQSEVDRRLSPTLTPWELLDEGVRLISPTGRPLFAIVDHRCEPTR
jgi:hypothetical protein